MVLIGTAKTRSERFEREDDEITINPRKKPSKSHTEIFKAMHDYAPE